MPGLLRVTALDEAGRPVPWARVYFVEAPVPMPEIAALTDGAGSVTLDMPLAGRYRIGLAGEGYETVILEVEIETEAEGPASIEAILEVVSK